MKQASPFAVEVVDDRNTTSPGGSRTASGDVLPAVAVMTGRDAATPGQGFAPFPLARRMLDFVRSVLWGWLGRRMELSATPSADEPSELHRIAIHESGHCLVARLRNRQVHSVTVIPNPEAGFSGRAMIGDGSPVYRTTGESYGEVDSISRVIDQHKPRPGESREDLQPWLLSVHENAVELLGGVGAEILAFGSANDATARSDYLKAQRYARTICASAASSEVFLEFAASEAVELLAPYRLVLAALARELVEQGTLDGAEIDRIIATALERQAHDDELARREKWQALIKRAQAFRGDKPR